MSSYRLQPGTFFLIIAILCVIECNPSSVWAKHSSKTASSTTEKTETFPLTHIKLATKPLSRWVYGFYPLDDNRILNDPADYLQELEQHMSRLDEIKGIKLEDDKRFADTLQYFIQQQLLSKNHKANALKLEHRLARIQSTHPDFCKSTKACSL